MMGTTLNFGNQSGMVSATVTINLDAPGGNPSNSQREGTLTVTHDGAGSPQELALTGR